MPAGGGVSESHGFSDAVGTSGARDSVALSSAPSCTVRGAADDDTPFVAAVADAGGAADGDAGAAADGAGGAPDATDAAGATGG